MKPNLKTAGHCFSRILSTVSIVCLTTKPGKLLFLGSQSSNVGSPLILLKHSNVRSNFRRLSSRPRVTSHCGSEGSCRMHPSPKNVVSISDQLVSICGSGPQDRLGASSSPLAWPTAGDCFVFRMRPGSKYHYRLEYHRSRGATHPKVPHGCAG